ncbi:MAG: ABC transporter substrate-binding protein [Geminicoccaceae bacterium]|nr:ABC transporter substrate-binding protein [Geminicoccaceae bacterium]
MIRFLVALCLLAEAFGAIPVARAFDNTLRVSWTLPLNVHTYAPNTSLYTVHFDISYLLFPRLVRSDEGGKWNGEAASSWFLSDDRRTLHFRLRDDLKWTNGQPLTAEDFARTFRQSLHPRSPKRNFLTFIRNAGDYDVDRDISHAAISTNGPHELVLELETPFAGQIDSIGSAFLLDNIVATPEGMSDEASWLSSGTTRVTGGPFRLVSVSEFEMLFDRDEDNPLSEGIEIERILMRHVDMSTAISDYVSDRADLLLGPLGNQRDWLVDRLPTDIIIDSGARIYMAAIHRDSEALADKDVRQALSLALDRENFGRHLFGKTFALPVGIIPNGISDYVADASFVNPAPRTYDERLALARELIAQSGHGASNPLRLKLIYATQVNGYREIVNFLKASWKNIHVDLEISLVENFWNSAELFNENRFDLMISSTFHEMLLTFISFMSGKFVEDILPSDKEFLDLRRNVFFAIGDVERLEAIREFDRYITQTFSLIPVAIARTMLFAKPYVDTNRQAHSEFRMSQVRLIPEKIPSDRP